MSVVRIQVVQLLLGHTTIVEDSLCLCLLHNQNQQMPSQAKPRRQELSLHHLQTQNFSSLEVKLCCTLVQAESEKQSTVMINQNF